MNKLKVESETFQGFVGCGVGGWVGADSGSLTQTVAYKFPC